MSPKARAGGAPAWSCPECGRTFTQQNQRHACGTGDRRAVLRDRPAALVAIYEVIEGFARSLGDVEVVTRQRYALFRSVRIFADLVMMAGAVRLAIHLRRRVDDPVFFKVVEGDKAVAHVAKLTTMADWQAVQGYMREAYELSIGRVSSP